MYVEDVWNMCNSAHWTVASCRPSTGKAVETVEPRKCFEVVATLPTCGRLVMLYRKNLRELEVWDIDPALTWRCFDHFLCHPPVLDWYHLTRTLLNQQNQWTRLTKPNTCMDIWSSFLSSPGVLLPRARGMTVWMWHELPWCLWLSDSIGDGIDGMAWHGMGLDMFGWWYGWSTDSATILSVGPNQVWKVLWKDHQGPDPPSWLCRLGGWAWAWECGVYHGIAYQIPFPWSQLKIIKNM